MWDTLALRDEEGRSNLRYALGNKKQVLIQRFPNGATHLTFIEFLDICRQLGELKHLISRRKRKQTRFPY